MSRILRRAKNKKGFTMIEMIVALVILAIMAAIAVPSLIGFIDRANERALLTEARSGILALQVMVTENGGSLPTGTGLTVGSTTFITDPAFIKLVQGVQNPGGFSNIEMGGTGRESEVLGIRYATADGKWVKISSTGVTSGE